MSTFLKCIFPPDLPPEILYIFSVSLILAKFHTYPILLDVLSNNSLSGEEITFVSTKGSNLFAS